MSTAGKGVGGKFQDYEVARSFLEHDRDAFDVGLDAFDVGWDDG